MRELPHRSSLLLAQHPWAWGVLFGLIVGGAVLLVSSIQHGLHPSNVLLGLVVFVGFGLIGVIGAVARGYRTGGPV